MAQIPQMEKEAKQTDLKSVESVESAKSVESSPDPRSSVAITHALKIQNQLDEHAHADADGGVGEVVAIAVKGRVSTLGVRAHADEEEAAGHLFEVVREVLAAHAGAVGLEVALGAERLAGDRRDVIRHRGIIDRRRVALGPLELHL